MRIGIVLAAGAAIAAITAIAACSGTPAPVWPERPERAAVIDDHMRANYDLSRAIEQLLLRGDLPAARSLARIIADVPVPADAAFAADAESVRARADALARAPTIDAAFRREAELAAACADCHRATGVSGDRGLAPPAPPDDDSIDARMARHRWAAALLWDAAIGGTDPAWRAGLDVLAQTPLDWPGRSERAGAARRLQDLAATARAGNLEPAERARVHGELLVACAACHAITGDADELEAAGIE